MTRYIVAITDFHERMAQGICSPGDRVIVFPKRGTRAQKLAAVPSIGWNLLRAAFDRDSHVLVSHPFSSVTSAFLAVARGASFFDDGTAYYAKPPLPDGWRERIDRQLSRRFVRWSQIAPGEATYPGMLRHARLRSFYAVSPESFSQLSFPVLAIDRAKAFPPVAEVGGDEDRVTLFLDTRDDALSVDDVGPIVDILHEFAASSPDAKLFFKPHPSQVSRVSRALRQRGWAEEVAGALESHPIVSSVGRLVSFYSSGALSVKSMNPSCEIVCLVGASVYDADAPRELFADLGAVEVTVDG